MFKIALYVWCKFHRFLVGIIRVEQLDASAEYEMIDYDMVDGDLTDVLAELENINPNLYEELNITQENWLASLQGPAGAAGHGPGRHHGRAD